MADIALTAAQIAPVKATECEIVDMIAAATITAGQAVYQTTAGKADVADANGAGAQQCRGIALKGGAAGQVIPVLRKGHVYGFTVSSMNGDALAYLSDTAGALADASGTMTVRVGRVTCLTDGNLTKVLFVDTPWATVWS